MAVDVYAGMNPEQRQAVAHLDGPLLVVAGAGSGKTRVITHRIANLVQHGVHPTRILAITFTNKAAGEMKERVWKLISLETPWITTFHSAGLRMIKREWARLGFREAPTVQDRDDLERTYRRIYEELKLDPRQIDPRLVMHQISTWKNQVVDIERHEPRGDIEVEARRCWQVWSRLQRDEHLVDFDDLLALPVRMLEADAEAAAAWGERFSHILIDEYQDTNLAQYRLIRALGGQRNVCATGDPDQAIYGWRGADFKNLMRFPEDFAGCAVVKLETNYRSTRTILRAAQGVIEHNVERMDKTIRTDNPDGRPITLVAVDTEQDESWAVAAAIERLCEREGRRRGDIAVFYRANAQSRGLEDALRRRGIAYRLVGGTRFYDREEVRHVLAYLRLLANPADRTSFLRIANVPARGLGETALDQLLAVADDEQVGPIDVLTTDALLDRVAIGRATRPMREAARLWRSLRALPLGDPAACVRGIIELTGLAEHYRRTEEPEKAEERVGNITEVISAADDFRAGYPALGVPGFLDQAALNGGEDRAGADDADRVTLMTLHAAKGLEFPVVFITACEDGILPLSRQGGIADLEEERRLMYVGITRAREELYLSRARTRMLYGRTNQNEPSRFLGEMPTDCFTSRDRTTREPVEPPAHGASALARARALGLVSGATLRRRDGAAPAAEDDDDAGLHHESAAAKAAATKRRNRRIAAEADATPHILDDDPYRPGQRIVHRVFGPGTVRAMHGPAGGRTIAIDFDDPATGAKDLAMTFAADKLHPA